jgi:aryl-alcohol dehydrogenase-like predicted oxidoreductase
MRKRRLGNSTLEVSVVGLGGNNFGGRIDFDSSARVVHKAIDLGVNFIDTADTYGNRGGSAEAWAGFLGQGRSQTAQGAVLFGTSRRRVRAEDGGCSVRLSRSAGSEKCDQNQKVCQAGGDRLV